MEHFTLYSSGIAVARFAAEGDTILHEMRDVHSLAFSAPAPVTEENGAADNALYTAYKMKPFFLLSQRGVFEAAVCRLP